MSNVLFLTTIVLKWDFYMKEYQKKPYDALDLGKTDPLLKEIYSDPIKKPTYNEKKRFSKIRNAIGRKKKRSIPEKK